jgi:hypothetical protein
MRRNVIDGAIFGFGIGAIVFLAQSLFYDVFWIQAAFVALSGLILFGVHLVVQRRRAALARRIKNDAALRLQEAEPPVHSPRLDWSERAPDSPAGHAADPRAPDDVAPHPADADTLDLVRHDSQSHGAEPES